MRKGIKRGEKKDEDIFIIRKKGRNRIECGDSLFVSQNRIVEKNRDADMHRSVENVFFVAGVREKNCHAS